MLLLSMFGSYLNEIELLPNQKVSTWFCRWLLGISLWDWGMSPIIFSDFCSVLFFIAKCVNEQREISFLYTIEQLIFFHIRLFLLSYIVKNCTI